MEQQLNPVWNYCIYFYESAEMKFYIWSLNQSVSDENNQLFQKRIKLVENLALNDGTIFFFICDVFTINCKHLLNNQWSMTAVVASSETCIGPEYLCTEIVKSKKIVAIRYRSSTQSRHSSWWGALGDSSICFEERMSERRYLFMIDAAGRSVVPVLSASSNDSLAGII